MASGWLLIFPTPLVLAFFWQQHPFFVHLCYFCTIPVYSKRYSKNFRDRSKKSRSREFNYSIIKLSIIKNVEHARPVASSSPRGVRP